MGAPYQSSRLVGLGATMTACLLKLPFEFEQGVGCGIRHWPVKSKACLVPSWRKSRLHDHGAVGRLSVHRPSLQ